MSTFFHEIFLTVRVFDAARRLVKATINFIVEVISTATCGQLEENTSYGVMFVLLLLIPLCADLDISILVFQT